MANKDSSLMLNDILNLASNMNIFSEVEEKKAYEFILRVIEIGENYDCNRREILKNIGEKLGICYCCLKQVNELEDGLCNECKGKIIRPNIKRKAVNGKKILCEKGAFKSKAEKDTELALKLFGAQK